MNETCCQCKLYNDETTNLKLFGICCNIKSKRYLSYVRSNQIENCVIPKSIDDREVVNFELLKLWTSIVDLSEKVDNMINAVESLAKLIQDAGIQELAEKRKKNEKKS